MRAPECLRLEATLCASDVWAFGVVAWEMFSISHERPDAKPYADLAGESTHDYVLGGGRLQMPAGMPEAVAVLARRCFAEQPQERPSFSSLIDALNSGDVRLAVAANEAGPAARVVDERTLRGAGKQNAAAMARGVRVDRYDLLANGGAGRYDDAVELSAGARDSRVLDADTRAELQAAASDAQKDKQPLALVAGERERRRDKKSKRGKHKGATDRYDSQALGDDENDNEEALV